MGGENQLGETFVQLGAGSSPRGRGKLTRDDDSAVIVGLIPAWAGKTETAPLRAIRCTAHPRVGGENVFASGSAKNVPGSSPRGRGKREPGEAMAGGEGLIPAWAGKTS